MGPRLRERAPPPQSGSETHATYVPVFRLSLCILIPFSWLAKLQKVATYLKASMASQVLSPKFRSCFLLNDKEQHYFQSLNTYAFFDRSECFPFPSEFCPFPGRMSGELGNRQKMSMKRFQKRQAAAAAAQVRNDPRCGLDILQDVWV